MLSGPFSKYSTEPGSASLEMNLLMICNMSNQLSGFRDECGETLSADGLSLSLFHLLSSERTTQHWNLRFSDLACQKEQSVIIQPAETPAEAFTTLFTSLSNGPNL